MLYGSYTEFEYIVVKQRVQAFEISDQEKVFAVGGSAVVHFKGFSGRVRVSVMRVYDDGLGATIVWGDWMIY